MPRTTPLTIVRRLIALAAAAALCGLAVPAAEAAQGFVPAVQVGGPTAPTQGDVATDANGDTIAVWSEGSPGAIFAAIRPAGGVFSPPQRLDDGTGGSQPRVASDGAGNAVAVWNQFTGNTNLVEIARRTAGQPFDTAGRQSEPAGGNPGNPHVVMSPGGDAIVGWLKLNPASGNTEVWAAITLAGQGAFGAGTALSVGSESATGFDLGIGSAGHAVALWTTTAGSSPAANASALRYATRDPGGTAFSGPSTIISGGNTPNSPAVAVDAAGGAVAAWRNVATTTTILASVRPAGGAFAPSGTLVGPTGFTNSANAGPAAGMDDAGNGWIVWAQTGSSVAASHLAAGTSSFSPPQTLESSAGVAPTVTMSAGGTAVAAWQLSGGGAVRGSFAAPGAAAFAPAQTLSGGSSTGPPRGSLDAAGDGAVVFADNPGGAASLTVRGFDSSPPQVQNLNVPAGATAGLPMSVSFTPFDVWGIGFTGWNFGDGTTATGPSASHTYAATGDYTATATTTDLVGNTTSATRPVHVTPLPLIPKEGKTVVAQVLSGKVYVATPVNVRAKRASLIKPPHGLTKLRRLTGSALIPTHSLVEASRGKVRIIAARNSASTSFQSGDYSRGAFKVTQGTTSPLTTATMMGGGNFTTGCRGVKGASVSAARRRPRRSLFSNVHGRFRTRGRNSTATVRGTAFLVKDTCAGTLTQVSRGTVIVRDLHLRKNVNVKAHHKYLARPRHH